MQFFKNIRSSIYDPAYYKEVLNKPFSYSLRYFLSLITLMSLIVTLNFSFFTLPEMSKVINSVSSGILEYYPDELEVAIKSGKVSTNVPEPYFIKIPAELKNMDEGLKNKPAGTAPGLEEVENLIVIDTVSPFTIDLFKSYKTASMLGRDSFAMYDNGAVKIQPLDQEVNGVVTKAKFAAILDKAMPYIKIIPYVLVPIVFFGTFIFSIIGYLIYLIFGAFVIWLAAQAAKREMGYGLAYKVGLHAITLGVILEFTLFWFYPQMKIVFFFTFLMVVAVWVNLNFASGADNMPPAPEGPNIPGKKE